LVSPVSGDFRDQARLLEHGRVDHVGHLGEVLDAVAGRGGIAQVPGGGGTARVPDKPRAFMPDLDFIGPYRAECDAIAERVGWL
jgi:hypothetical protein